MIAFGLFAIIAVLVGAAIWLAPKGWRTMAVNAAAALPMILLELANFAVGVNWAELFPAEWMPRILVGVNLLNMALRYFTTTRVGEKRP
jgi:uncharacterized protein YjeT (DUF2065 family)